MKNEKRNSNLNFKVILKTEKPFSFMNPIQSVHRKCHSSFILKLEWKSRFLCISISIQNWKLKTDKNFSIFNFQFLLENWKLKIFEYKCRITQVEKSWLAFFLISLAEAMSSFYTQKRKKNSLKRYMIYYIKHRFKYLIEKSLLLGYISCKIRLTSSMVFSSLSNDAINSVSKFSITANENFQVYTLFFWSLKSANRQK